MSLELAWAAGFFDGEGSAYVQYSSRTKYAEKGKYAYPAIQVTQKDPRPLQRFMDALGGIGNVRGPYDKHNGQCFWHKAGKGALEVVEMLWPYLSEPKREQIEEVKRVVDEHTEYSSRR